VPQSLRHPRAFNILCANPSFAIFYGYFFRHHDANSSILKDLELQSGFLLIQIDPNFGMTLG
jgi:hypothetical protein